MSRWYSALFFTSAAYFTRFASATAFASPPFAPALARMNAGRLFAPALAIAAAVSEMYCSDRV